MTQNGPVGTGGSELVPAISLNIWSVIALPSLSFDTMDVSESWGGNFCRFMFENLLKKPQTMTWTWKWTRHGPGHGHRTGTGMDKDMDTEMDTNMEMDTGIWHGLDINGQVHLVPLVRLFH